jgi:hypothetical protein
MMPLHQQSLPEGLVPAPRYAFIGQDDIKEVDNG